MDENIRLKMKEFDELFKKAKGFGIEFIPADKDPYKGNIDRAVEICSGNSEFLGFYRGLEKNGDNLVLFPFAEQRFIPESVIMTKDGNSTVIRMYEWSDRPAFIINAHPSILPVDEKYLFCRVEQGKRELTKRIIIP